MRIHFTVFSSFDPLHGANLRVFHIIREAEARGHETAILVPDHQARESCQRHFRATVDHLGISLSRFSRSKVLKYPLFALKARSRIPAGFDLYFGQSLPPTLALTLARGRLPGATLFDLPDLWSEYWYYAHQNLVGGVVHRMVRAVERSCLRRADLVTTVTRSQADTLRARGRGRQPIRVIPEGVDTERFAPAEVPDWLFEKYGLSPRPTILCQGGIEAHDGIQFLIRALPAVLAVHPDTTIVIAGEGSYLPTVKRLAVDAGLESHFVFTGWVPYEDMPHFMNLATISLVLLPDHDATRGIITIKLLESLASGTPTLAADLPGIRETVRHRQSSYLIRSEDPAAIADALNTLLSDGALREEICRNGRRLVQPYDWQVGARSFLDSMEALNEGPGL